MQQLKKIAFLLVCSLTLLGSHLLAQQYLELVENKGQWHESIAFKGELTNGSFAILKNGGYRLMLHHSDDLKAITAYFHGHSSQLDKPPMAKAKTSSAANAANQEFPDQLLLRSQVIQATFINAQPFPQALPDKPLSSYNNYFIGNNPQKWASECKIFTAVTFKNLYPNIDIRYYTNNGQLKYDLIVHPGANPNNIAVLYDGANSVTVRKEELVLATEVGEIKEAKPYTFQPSNSGRKEIAVSYKVKGNLLKFQINDTYNPELPLIIDPQLVFSTFTGSAASNWGFTATYDYLGNFYSGGIVFGVGFPQTNGFFQSNFAGGNTLTGESSGFDIGIMKFNPRATARLYSTYLGGSGNEYPHSLVCDASGQLIMAGRATSTDYPTTRSSYGPGGGTYDIVLSKLNERGTQMVGSLRIGGTGSDGVNIANKYPVNSTNAVNSLRRYYGDDSRSEVIVDDADNVYLSSSTQSSDFPTTANAVQRTNGGANAVGRAQDGVFIKLNPDLSNILYSTYLGGNDDDAAFVLAINPLNNDVYVAGGTASRNFPGNKTGVLFPNYRGQAADGFVAVFSNDGSELKRSSYFGTDGVDIIYGIQFDRFGFPYIMGTTTGAWPVTSNVGFSQPGGKQFISKLRPDLSNWEYSTVFGTNSAEPNISPTAFLVDRCENVYVSGWGGRGNSSIGYPNSGTLGLRVTPDAIKSTTEGSDFYFFVLERNARSQLYGSFFGQDDNIARYPDHVDGGTSRFDKNGVIYQSVCANCEGPNGLFFTSPGVVAPLNGALSASAGGCNLAAIKIAFNLAGVGASLQSSVNGIPRTTTGCLPLTVDFRDTIAMGRRYVWDFGDGSPQVVTTDAVNRHTYNQLGSFRVMLVSIDSSACNIADTSYITIRVRDDAAQINMQIQKVGGCESTTYQFANTSQSFPGKPFNSNSFILHFGDGTTRRIGAETVTHTYAGFGTYDVKLVLVDTNFCNSPDSITRQLRIAPNVRAQIGTSPTGCAPYLANIRNTSVGGTEFIWNFGNGVTFNGTNPPPQLYATPGTYTIQLTVNDPASCNLTDATSVTINVSGKPVAAFNFNPNPPTENTPINFNNLSVGGVRFKWDFGDGDTLITIRRDTIVQHSFNATQTYNVCLTAYNAAGCDSTVCLPVAAKVVPILDIANAFAPSGNNRTIKVQSFGIRQMNWRIYNRWGVLVFQSTDRNKGWDGTYNGVAQPMDVYTYIIEAVFTDNTKLTKTGDITLLR